MGATILDRTAATDHPVLDVLADRWSPRAYAGTSAVDEAKLSSALEAARWSPSAYNGQPWRFIVARRGSEAHAAVVSALVEFNQLWASHAPVLVVAVAEVANAEGRANSHAVYDLGQAVAHLSIQAHHDGLLVHQMSGFDADAVRARFGLEERFAPTTVIALGELGDVDALPEALRERETAPRERRPLAETVIIND
ncbi:nitroreductase family protein [Microbacterium sp. NPDC055683]